MITLNNTLELLRQEEKLSAVEAVEDRFCRASFENPLDPGKLMTLIAHPITEELVLRILVPQIAYIPPNSRLHLYNLSLEIQMGRFVMDPRDGELLFLINHPCVDGGLEDPNPQVFFRLIRAAINSAHRLKFEAAYTIMTDSGIPEARARAILDKIREEGMSGDQESWKDVI